jgi:hypothetical protein
MHPVLSFLSSRTIAGVLENAGSVLIVDVLIELQPDRRTTQQPRQRSFAYLDRFAPQIVTIEFEQVEGDEGHVPLPPAQQVEVPKPILILNPGGSPESGRSSLWLKTINPNGRQSRDLEDNWRL